MPAYPQGGYYGFVFESYVGKVENNAPNSECPTPNTRLRADRADTLPVAARAGANIAMVNVNRQVRPTVGVHV